VIIEDEHHSEEPGVPEVVPPRGGVCGYGNASLFASDVRLAARDQFCGRASGLACAMSWRMISAAERATAHVKASKRLGWLGSPALLGLGSG
jgi:hypothetical protein